MLERCRPLLTVGTEANTLTLLSCSRLGATGNHGCSRLQSAERWLHQNRLAEVRDGPARTSKSSTGRAASLPQVPFPRWRCCWEIHHGPVLRPVAHFVTGCRRPSRAASEQSLLVGAAACVSHERGLRDRERDRAQLLPQTSRPIANDESRWPWSCSKRHSGRVGVIRRLTADSQTLNRRFQSLSHRLPME